jgi:Reverse transcriptase (RNA-dependent DNA polymerase)
MTKPICPCGLMGDHPFAPSYGTTEQLGDQAAQLRPGFSQSPRRRELYMKIPKGIKVESDTEYALKVERNLYGQKQAGRVWNLHLVRKLIKIGFQQSQVDKCLFYKGNTMYVLYTDDSILAGS